MEHVKMPRIKVKTGNPIAISLFTTGIRVGGQAGARPFSDGFPNTTAHRKFEFGGERTVFAEVYRWRHNSRDSGCCRTIRARAAAVRRRVRPVVRHGTVRVPG